MIATILRLNWLILSRDRVAQMVTLLLPIIFFSIFATIFGGMAGGSGDMVVQVAIADLEDSSVSSRLIAALDADPRLEVMTSADDGSALDTQMARELVTDGTLSVALEIPAGFSDAMRFDPEGSVVTLFADTSDPIAPQMVGGLFQAAVFRALPDLWMFQGMESFKTSGEGLSQEQKDALDRYRDSLAPSNSEIGPETTSPGKDESLVHVQLVDALRGERKDNPTIPYYAASTGVMFLLFMVSSAGGTLLQEKESGVLERLLSSNLTMGQLIVGKWLYISLLGVLQVTLMFVWGSLVFDLELWTAHHLLGFVIMAAVTAAAASGLGVFLATLCRTRAQLSGFSVILVLTMSALGGSMFPRFLMPDWMQTVGLLTFNAWALDGFQKVFWYNRPLLDLWPQVGVLVLLTLGFLTAARRLARRWETT